jgi:hypothetical protein
MPDTAIGTTLPHRDFGNPDCCGCLIAIITGDEAATTCNECATVIRTVLAAHLEQTLTEMELTLAIATELCPHCGSVHVFPGFSKVDVYICHECGESVSVQSRAKSLEAIVFVRSSGCKRLRTSRTPCEAITQQ